VYLTGSNATTINLPSISGKVTSTGIGANLAAAPAADRTMWVTDRSKLHQVPETQKDPFDIVWPEALH